MNPRIATSLGIAALLGLMWRIAPPAEGAREASREESRKEASAHKQETAALSRQGPWLATCRFFGQDPPQTEADSARLCAPKDNPPSYTFVIATVPDPSRSRLAMFLDRAIESIQKGAQAAAWQFDSQWLPWTLTQDEAGGKMWVPADPGISEPGILIFRGKPSAKAAQFPHAVLLLFVAGETPTGGIDLAAFHKALQYREAFQEKAPFIVIGPTFSGSLPSLAKALGPVPPDRVLAVASGTVTRTDYIHIFQGLPFSKNFWSGALSSSETTRDVKVVAGRLNIGLNQVAILSEDETAFGGAATAQTEVPSIRFPREISSLRNAWQTASGQQKPLNNDPIPFSLRDLEGGADSVPVFGVGQTPVSQYAVLTELARRIRQKFRLVEISATNVFDALFIAGVLHEGAPDTRLLIPAPDLLFTRAAREQSLTGVLALSHYPLYPLQSKASDPGRKNIDVFPDGYSEGVYRATVQLLTRNGAAYVPVLDWLHESTAAGFQPVAAFPHAGNADDGTLTPDANSLTAYRDVPLPRQWWIFDVIAICAGIWLGYRVLTASRDPRTSYEVFRTPAGAGAACHRIFLIFALGWMMIILAVLNVPLGAPIIDTSSAKMFLPIVLGVSVLVLITALVRSAQRGRLAGWTALAGWVGFAAILASLVYLGTDWVDANLLAIRVVHVDSGASPAVPIALLVFALLSCSIFQMNRLSMARHRNPGRPRPGLRNFDIALARNLNLFGARVEGVTEHPAMGFPKVWPLAGVALLFVIVVAWVEPWRFLYTSDGRGISLIIFILAAIVLAAMGWTLHALRLVWKSLRRFLNELNWLPMEGAFRRLPHQFSGSAIWAGMPMSRSFVTFFGSTECLCEFVEAYSRLDRPDAQFLNDAKEHLVRLEESEQELRRWERSHVLHGHRQLVKNYRRCADFLLYRYLVPLWNSGKSDPDPGRGEHSAEDPDRVSPEEKAYRLAAKFVALRYAAWLRYVLRHIRNLLFFISIGYVCLSLALLSVSFQAPQVIRWFLTILFLAIGVVLLQIMIQMDRDAVLSRMADDTVGQLNKGFYIRAASYVSLPLLGVLSNQFPGFARFLFSWLQPTMDALK